MGIASSGRLFSFGRAKLLVEDLCGAVFGVLRRALRCRVGGWRGQSRVWVVEGVGFSGGGEAFL